MYSSISFDMLKNPFLVLKICGAWPIAKFGRFQWIHTIFVFVFYISFNMLMVLYLPNASYIDLIETINSLAITIFIIFQLIMVRINYNKFVHVFEMMQTIERNYLSDKDLDILTKKSKFTNLLHVVLTFVYVSAMTIALFTAFINDDYVLVFPSYFPYDYTDRNRPGVYYCTILYQYFSSLFSSFACAALNSYGPVLYTILTTYLRLLGMKVRAVGWEQSRSKERNTKTNEIKLENCAKLYKLCIR